ncbi:MAG: hypothetical protein IKV61_01180 [Clostridia bacterium]|nr:hypothetical protein [Clostridia bacterium]
MVNWQVTNKNEITKVNSTINLESVNDVKVKITKCYVSRKDVLDFIGKTKRKAPFTPSNIAVGQITETLQESNYFVKGTKVYLAPMNAVDLPEDSNEKGLTAFDDGFLKEFQVISKNNIHILPSNVSESDALYIYHVSLAISVIDSLNVKQGDYVAIIGGTTLANVIAQLVMYYKAVPIVIDSNVENLDLAYKTDIYYTLKANKELEKNVLSITGGRKCPKVIYVTDSDIDTNTIDSVSALKATVTVTGFTDCKQKLSLTSFFDKQLQLNFIKSGYSNIGAAINLLVQKAVNLSYYKLPDYKFEYIPKHFENSAKKLENGENCEFTVNLL